VADVDRIRSLQTRAVKAASARDWREAVRQLRAAEALWPEPQGWLARQWRKWRLGEPLEALEARRKAIVREARIQCAQEAERHLGTLATSPTAKEAAADLLNVAADMALCGAADEEAALKRRVTDWRRTVTTYQQAIGDGHVALRKLRYRDAAAAFEVAERHFVTEEASKGLAAARAGLRTERHYDTLLECAVEALAAGRPITARAWAERARAKLPRDDAQALVLLAERLEEAGAHERDAFEAARAGAWSRAERAFGSVEATLGPAHPAAGLSRLRQASMAILRGTPERALSHLDGLPGREAAARRGLTLSLLGRHAAAAACLRDAGHEAQAACARAHAARRTWHTLVAIADSVSRKAWDEAERLAGAHLAVEDDAAVQAALQGTVAPGRARHAWETTSAAARVASSLTELRASPGAAALHNWFVALDEAREGDPAHVPDWLAAAAAVIANLDTSPAFDTPHRAWLAQDREALRSKLRERVEQFLDAAREAAPASEQGWRDLWRIEAGALELASPERRWPTLAGLNVTPGLRQRLGGAGTPLPTRPGASPEDQAFVALYSPWAAPVGAWLARDSERVLLLARDRSTEEGDPAARGFVAAMVVIERAIQGLEAGDGRALEAAKPHGATVKAHGPWREAIDRLAGRLVERLDDEGDDLGPLVKAWRDLTGSEPAAVWYVRHEAAVIAKRLDDKQLAPEEALRRLQGLLGIAPGHAIATDLMQRIRDRQAAPRIDAALNRGELAQAVAIALRECSPSVRSRLAELLLEHLEQHAQRLSRSEIRRWAGWMHELVPDNPLYEELWRDFN
jgi:hypothetical protein